MALIKCKSCGHMISDKAVKCPKCGCTTTKGEEPVPQEEAQVRPVPQEAPQVQPVPQEEPQVQPVPQEEPQVHSIPQEEPQVQPAPREEPHVQPIPQEKPQVQPVHHEEGNKGNSKKVLYATIGVLVAALIGLGLWMWQSGTFGGNGSDRNVSDSSIDDVMESDLDGTYQLRGEIGPYGAMMSITIDGKDVTGLYHYDSGGNLSLNGKLKRNGSLTMNEYAPNGKNSGRFEGTFDGKEFRGTFYNLINGKQFPYMFLPPKEHITTRLEEVFDDVVEGNVHEYDESLFSSDFRKTYNRVAEIDRLMAQDGYIGFWEFGFWDMAQDDVTMNITVNDVYNIEDDKAMAKVTFKFSFGGQTETRKEEIKVVLENGKWVLDDIHGYKKQMKEFIKENKDYQPSDDMESLSDDYQDVTSARSSSSNNSYRFSTAYDVIGYLADKSFYNGNRCLRIRENGVWFNDMCVTGAPTVERFESWKALIRAYTPTGQRFSYLIDPVNGQVTDDTGDIFTLR